jgi:hypothetical protein
MADQEQADEEKLAAEQVAQHLANLVGRSVAGFTPKTSSGNEPDLDLDEELFVRRNVGVASLVILSTLLHEDKGQQQNVLRQIKPEYLGEKSFDHFLFKRISDHLTTGENFSASDVEASIQEYGPAIWNEPSSERSLQGYRFTWKQLLRLRPTGSLPPLC